MILDGHIHIRAGQGDPAAFHERLKQAGVGGGLVISEHPASFGNRQSPSKRLDDLFRWTGPDANLFPFYWIDPLERDAAKQVAMAVERGVNGFKVICDHFDPGDGRAMRTFRTIAKSGRPILFHSGILWDGKPSGSHCRPAGFEALLEIDGLRFSLAHVSWPWCDECIAVYGKFLNAHSSRPDLSVEMFIDLTPGTPPIYRRDALTKLFTVGYDIESNVVFGTDCCANDYNAAWAREWIGRDNAIYRELGLPAAAVKRIYADNLRRFVGLAGAEVRHRALRPGE